MKVKIKQNVYLHEVKRLVDYNEEIELSEKVAKSMIEAGYAEAMAVEPPKKPRKKAGDE